MTPEQRNVPSCGFIPPTPGYAPCTREYGHEGSRAHELAEVQYKIKITHSSKWRAAFVYYAEPTYFHKLDSPHIVQLANDHRMLRIVLDSERSEDHGCVMLELAGLGRYIEVAWQPKLGVPGGIHRQPVSQDLCLPDTPEVRALIQQL